MRDNELQALTRVLQNKLIQSETRFVELSESAKGSGVIDQQRISLLTESNQRLLEVLRTCTGLQQIPFVGTGTVLIEYADN